jgi:mannose-1-phosphate guanylyltransferase
MEERLLYEKRQWGEFHVLHERTFPDGISMLTKELIIEPGKGISYQRHFHRDEYWTIVDGEGVIIIDEEKVKVGRGDTFIIRKNQLHTIKANSQLTIIEVQIGDILSEDDIERLPYTW